MTRMTGGHALAAMFAAHGAQALFGMGGFQLLPYYEGLRALGLPHHLVDDERSGWFAADAHARLTGRPGVVDATLGPGATNLVTGLVESSNAGIPMIAVVGDAHRSFALRNMTQEARQVEILRPAAKDLIRIEVVERIPEFVRRAYAVATSGRPGPVVLIVPEDVAHAEIEFDPAEFSTPIVGADGPAHRTRPAATDMRRAADLLRTAARPVILAGGGVHLSGAYDELAALAEAWQIPVAHTLSGKGAIGCAHPLSVGLFGRYSRYANELIESCDCVLAVGCKLGEIATKRYVLPPAAVPLIHLDVLPEEIDRWRPAEVALCGDARSGLADLSTALADAVVPDRMDYLGEIERRRATWQQRTQPQLDSDERPISMARLINELSRAMPDDGIVVADGGFAAHWAGLLYDTKRAGRGFVTDRGLASIGYGLPASIGCSLARPGAAVVGITGDGGMNMTLGGLEVALRAKAAFTLIVVNNAASGYVKALQHAMYGRDSYQSSDLHELNYAAIAEAFGCRGIRVEDPALLADALRCGIADRERPTVIDVVVTRSPDQMLPGVDSRAPAIRKGDRIA